MPTYGLLSTPRAFLLADEAGLLLAEAHRSRVALDAALHRIARHRDVQLVVDEITLRDAHELEVSALQVPLHIVPAEVLEAAQVLARLPRRSRRTAALLARLPSVPWLAAFIRTARPMNNDQLSLL